MRCFPFPSILFLSVITSGVYYIYPYQIIQHTSVLHCNTEEKLTVYENIELPENSTVCELCQISVQIIRDEIRLSNSTIHYIEDFVQVICDIMGQNETCHKVIDDINLIISYIDHGCTPSEICEELNLCKDEFCYPPMNYFIYIIKHNVVSDFIIKKDETPYPTCIYSNYKSYELGN